MYQITKFNVAEPIEQGRSHPSCRRALKIQCRPPRPPLKHPIINRKINFGQENVSGASAAHIGTLTGLLSGVI